MLPTESQLQKLKTSVILTNLVHNEDRNIFYTENPSFYHVKFKTFAFVII